MSSRVLASYRNLLRASRVAFNKDLPTLAAARMQIQQGFKNEKDATLTEAELNERLTYANDISTILRRNIVQGARDDEAQHDRYSKSDPTITVHFIR
ncbi:hypothetical protein TRICI_006766 [Trichomonascus ciferrii]|uniref:Mitochondrial zinc maintenance protein 1, mitochondrial n=1 Tax=Trichomonascus ciferrii TaxID=44093 RepID=A0A642UDR1_9ASCO|nr:hypothetical protein TRICI_006766 [Trichomonascus ciferrii]